MPNPAGRNAGRGASRASRVGASRAAGNSVVTGGAWRVPTSGSTGSVACRPGREDAQTSTSLAVSPVTLNPIRCVCWALSGRYSCALAVGIGDALIQQRHLQPSSFDTPFILSVAASLVIAGVVGIFADRIAVAVPGLTPFVVSAAVLVPFSVIASFQEAMLKRELQFRTLAIRTLVSGLSGGVVGIAMALAGSGERDSD